MISPRGAVLILMVLAIPACVSEEGSRRDANREQVEAFLALQATQNRIEEFARSLTPVRAANAYLRPDFVLVKMYLLPGTPLGEKNQEDLNAFITKLTGIPRERITLAVPESSMSAQRRDE